MGDLSPHFSRHEFACKGCADAKPCARMDVQLLPARSLVRALEIVRTHYNAPVTVNSGYRCPEYNQAVGGSSRSQHLQARAADITVAGVDPAAVYEWIDSWHRGGLGKYETFTHIDTRTAYTRWKG